MKLQDFDFRIYDGNKKGYLTEDKLESVGLGIEKCDRIGAFLHFHDDRSIDYYIENIEIELYTGFKDSNGKKIYEGDIVVHYAEEGSIEYYSKVVFSQEKGAFEFVCIEHPITATFAELENVDIGVVGNIHENPELLGGEK